MSTRFTGATAGEFTTVGWPGFIGVFSGVAPRRFAVTLNAVISDEPLQAASPVVFLLRQVLEEAPDFQAALRTLKNTPLASDSLLLLTGIRAGEMAVIERTPYRAEVRLGENGSIFVTNDYRLMQTGLRGAIPNCKLRHVVDTIASRRWSDHEFPRMPTTASTISAMLRYEWESLCSRWCFRHPLACA